MQIPEAFYDFCLLLHQDSFDFYGREPQDLAAGPLRYMSNEQKVALRTFLDHLLSGNYSDEQLDEIYRQGDADIGFRSGLRYFFGLVRDTIDRGA
jgi:hypothetical protein